MPVSCVTLKYEKGKTMSLSSYEGHFCFSYPVTMTSLPNVHPPDAASVSENGDLCINDPTSSNDREQVIIASMGAIN